jgi:YD repeat-containing protein
MIENLSQVPQEKPQNNEKENTENLDVKVLERLFGQAEIILEKEGREKAKLFLPVLYRELMTLNKRDASDWKTQWIWNPDGNLTEEEFNRINLRRKLLSNAIGIMTASGVIRHNLNEV